MGGEPHRQQPSYVERWRFNRLLLAHRDLREEVKALVACLACAGVVCAADLHRWRFDKVRERTRWTPSPCTFEDILTAEPRIASRAGKAALLALRAGSSGCRARAEVVRKPKLYITGGVMSILGEEAWLDTAERFEPRVGDWEPLPAMPVGRAGHASGVLGGRLYVCGGWSDYARAVVRFNPTRCRWENAAQMNSPRAHAAAAVVGPYLYVCGGEDDIDDVGHVWSSVERLDPRTPNDRGTWQDQPSMLAARRTLGVAALDGRLLACGGHGVPTSADDLELSPLASAEALDFAAGTWQPLPPMTVHRSGHGAGTIRGEAYICGGVRRGIALSSAERFDPDAGAWFGLPKMLWPRHEHAVAVMAGRLYACGGWHSHSECVTAEASAEAFDPDEGRWQALPFMLEPRGFATAVVITSGYTAF